LFKQDPPKQAKASKVDACDVWHQRLGHPSNGIMLLFSNKVRIFENKGSDKPYDVYF